MPLLKITLGDEILFQMEMPQVEYSDEDLLGILRRKAELLGRSPSAVEIAAGTGVTSGIFQSRFGTWNNALKEAGLEARPQNGSQNGRE